MLDLSVIILTYNEELHIRRCLDNVKSIAKEIFLIDSFSTDKTLDIAKTYEHVIILQHKWENNHAKQFNWGLENASISTKWILRLDADEYLLPALLIELIDKLPCLDKNITGIVFNRRHIFLETWMKRGIYPVKLLRLFQYGKGFCEQRFMDEHIQIIEGDIIEFENDFVDHNLNNISWFCHKHVDYAIREAVDLLDIELDLTGTVGSHFKNNISNQAIHKRTLKYKYVKSPLFIRAFLYFLYRYFIKRACLDGKVGFIWTFLQCGWYRILVDIKVFEIKNECGDDKNKIRQYLRDNYHIYV